MKKVTSLISTLVGIEPEFNGFYAYALMYREARITRYHSPIEIKLLTAVRIMHCTLQVYAARG